MEQDPEEYFAELDEAARAVLPPKGSVFSQLDDGTGGPPMMRMVIMQMVFGGLSKAAKITRPGKVLVIFLVCSAMIIRDFSTFLKMSNPNIYGQIGLTRTSTMFQFEEAFDQYHLCVEYEDDCRDPSMSSPIYQLTAEQVADIKYVVSDAQLKELYDKTETFIRKKTRSKYMPSEGQRYISAFKELSSYAGYVFLMFIIVEQHQHFAKQMVIGTLIVFASISVQMRVPKEGGNDENAIIKMIDSIPFLKGWCYFEINYVLKSVLYPGLFHMALHISRMIDVAPEAALKFKLLETQRELTKSLLACEMVTQKRKTEQVEEPEEAKSEPKSEEPEGMKLRSGKVINKDLGEEKAKNEEQKTEDKEQTKEPQEESKEDGDGDGAEPQEGEDKNELAVDVSGYGAPDPDMFDAYKWVIGKRKQETYSYMSARIERTKNAEKARSIASKCGSLIKTLFIYGSVAAIVIPMLWSIYVSMNEDSNENKMAENIREANRANMSEEDITKAAQDREAEMDAEKEEYWRQYDESVAKTTETGDGEGQKRADEL